MSDVVELQAQSLERGTSTYATFVRDAAAQARAANPRVAILAGLSTNPPGAEVTSQQLAPRSTPPAGSSTVTGSTSRAAGRAARPAIPPAGRGPGGAARRVVSQPVPDHGLEVGILPAGTRGISGGLMAGVGAGLADGQRPGGVRGVAAGLADRQRS